MQASLNNKFKTMDKKDYLVLLILPLIIVAVVLQNFKDANAGLHKIIEVAILNLEFSRYDICEGFDDTTDPPWLVVPKGDTRKARVRITPSIASSEITFENDNRDIATVSPSTPSGSPSIITITGAAEGKTTIVAKAGTTVVGRLNISVKEKKLVKVALHYIKDNAGHSTPRQEGDDQDFIDSLNDVWTHQANIEFILYAVDEPIVLMDLGDVVVDSMYTPQGGAEWNAVVAHATSGVDVNIFFVWKLGCDDPSGIRCTGALSGGDQNVLFDINTLSENDLGGAHEMGHVFGIEPSDYPKVEPEGQLMDEVASGCKLLKSEVDQAKP